MTNLEGSQHLSTPPHQVLYGQGWWLGLVLVVRVRGLWLRIGCQGLLVRGYWLGLVVKLHLNQPYRDYLEKILLAVPKMY